MTQPSTVQMPAAQSAPLTLTPAGRERLENRLEHLRGVRRQEVADTLAQVRGEGDISENPLFDQTIFEGLRLEHEIEDLEERLARAVVGVQRTECGVAAVGDRVVLELVLEGKPPEDAPPTRRWTFVLVNPEEVSLRAPGKLARFSTASPVGQALLGRRVGDTFTVQVKRGPLRYRVLELGARRLRATRARSGRPLLYPLAPGVRSIALSKPRPTHPYRTGGF